MVFCFLRRSILLSVLVFFAIGSSAQKFTGFFHISGRIRVDAGDPAGAVVTLINVSAKSNENSATVNTTGKFEFDLKYFKEYKLTVVKDDYYTKYIDVSTIVPPQVWAKDSIFPPFTMVVTIYKKVPDVVLSFEGKTVGKLCYNPKGKLDNFDADIYIDDKVIRKEIDQALKAHEDEFFNKKIAEAVEFEKKNQIREAIKAYEEALAIRKNDQFIKPKLKELTSDLKNLDKDALLEGQFNKLVSAGDENVAGLRFPDAIDNYKAALAIKPGHAAVSGKLSSAEQLLAKMNAEKAKAEADRLAAEKAKAEADKLAAEKAKAEADKLAAEKAKAEADRLAAEKAKAEADRLAAEKAKAEADRLAAEKAKAEADRLAAEKAKAEADRLAAEKAKAEADRLAAEKAKAEADRLAAEKAKAEADRLAAEKAKAEADKLAAEKAKAEADRLAAEKAKAEADRLAAEKAKAEADRLAAEKAKAEADRLAAEKAKAEADKLAAEKAKAEADRLAAEKVKAEADRLAAEKAKAEADKLAAEKAKAEADRLAAEKAKAEADRLAAEKAKAEADRLAAEKAKAEADRLAAEKAKAEADRLAAEKAKAEADRLAAEKAKAEADKLAAEKAKAEADRLLAEKAKAEADRLAAEKAKAEADRLAAEKAKAEADRLAAEKAKAEADRLAAEKAKAEAARLAAEQAKAMAEQQNKLQAEDTYLKNIQIGDANYSKSLWSVAIFYYQEALKLKSADKYALERIDNCRKMIDSNISAEKMQEYNSYIKHADADMLEKKYSSARFYYGKAGVILPWENYPKGRLNEVEKLISSTNIDSDEAGYFDAIKKADDAVAQKSFAVARFYFQKAISLKPNEDYPKQQLKRLTTEF